jgi:hypothetical protein
MVATPNGQSSQVIKPSTNSRNLNSHLYIKLNHYHKPPHLSRINSSTCTASTPMYLRPTELASIHRHFPLHPVDLHLNLVLRDKHTVYSIFRIVILRVVQMALQVLPYQLQLSNTHDS